MTSSAEAENRNQIAEVRFDDEGMCVLLQDGREISVPLWWYPRLLHATPEQREKWEILPFGELCTGRRSTRTRGFLIGAKAPDARPPVEA